ncbi:rCG22802 [Rattus norvegicus]|uniref:RCG22802 n=1 Tax=Rattus norvegicus TaxID=10116 RepID=A6JYJ7_RAT|nr:rCG22802 [Rattus norvegicus]
MESVFPGFLAKQLNKYHASYQNDRGNSKMSSLMWDKLKGKCLWEVDVKIPLCTLTGCYEYS